MPKQEKQCAYCGNSFTTYLDRQKCCSHRCDLKTRERDDNARFWSHVNRRGDDECWEWQASRDNKGYGQTYYHGRGEVAHRVSYLIHYGEFDRSKLVCHTCDNPPCVNPHHLFLGTPLDNTHDSWRKGRGRNTPKPGVEHHAAKLMDSDVRLMRQLAKEGINYNQLAKRFGITRENARLIILRRAWSHLPD